MCWSEENHKSISILEIPQIVEGEISSDMRMLLNGIAEYIKNKWNMISEETLFPLKV